MPSTGLEEDKTTYNDKYVVLYDFSDIGKQLFYKRQTINTDHGGSDRDTAVKEVKTLLEDLEEIGLHTEVRAGYEQSLLIFIRAPHELLGNWVYKSRQVMSSLILRDSL
jgi:anoctamin-10